MTRHHPAPTRRPRRRGLTSIAALAALLVVALVCGAILKAGLARRAALADVERGLQAAWLAESGLDRAAARLAADPGYAGETWSIPADDLGGRGPGRVEIRVEPGPDAEGRRASVTADYPSDSPRLARRSRSGAISIPRSPR